MSNSIIAGTTTLASGVLTFTMKIADGGPSVENYDISFLFNAAKATSIEVTGATGWTVVPNSSAGSLVVGGFNLTPALPGTVLLTVKVTLANAADTSFAVSYSGSFNEAGTLAQTSLVLGTASPSNAAPLGLPTVEGNAAENQTLSAVTSGISDADGLGAFSYQWLRDGTAVTGATSATYTLGDADVGRKMSVQVRYTDGAGKQESLTSAQSANVSNVNDLPTGAVTFSGTATQGQTLTAANTLADADGLGTIGYQWLSNGTAITGATGSTYTLTQAEVGKAITVRASYTDGQGTTEGVTSSGSALVANINDLPTGGITINGNPTRGQTLTATSALADADGLGTLSYQWLANGTAITGATGSTYTLTQTEVGKTVTVRVSYTDAFGAAESVLSAATGPVIASTNNSTTGDVTFSGTATQGETLTAANTLADVDGLGAISYQWLSNGTAITGAIGSTYTLTQAEVGKAITVQASYTDALGTAESRTSTASAAVANVNDAPTGTVTVTGTATQGETLTAANTLADVDGLGAISYQWLSNSTAITGAIGSTYTLTQAEVGKAITVQASYTDALGTAESRTSTATAAVANVNDAPTGTVTVTGTATQGETLTAANTLADADGLGAISYQWLSNGTAITGATGSTYTLTQAEVGKAITVQASYTDALGTAESRTSTATAAVANVNDAPTGTVAVTGTAAQGETLTAANTLADVDGLGAISYQWLSNGTAITGATGSTYTLTQAEVGKAITVRASYADGQGTAESRSSTATAAVGNINDLPTGSIAISGAPTRGQTLSAVSTLADPDGLGTLSYRWLADGTAIQDATGSTYTLTQAEVGKTVTVRVSYTDALGAAEVITSAATDTIIVNNPSSGNVTLSGTAIQGETLTAANTLADADGLGAISYQWLSNGTAITGATGSTYTLTQAEVGKAITVQASYTDALGTAESRTSTATAAVANVNETPTGTVTVTGTATQGETLTAANTLADVDGIPTTGADAVHYQWLADGATILGATGATLTLTQAHVAKAISVHATYRDLQGTTESRTSTATGRVVNTNDAPQGALTITGITAGVVQGATLSVLTSGITDADGIDASGFIYQWLADGIAISSANGSSIKLEQAQVGKAISVKASYVDGGSFTNEMISSATAVVQNLNDAPTGSLSVGGVPIVGMPLKAASTLADVDGLGTLSYQWLLNGVDIANATSATYTALQAGSVSVRVSYTDGFGTAESRTSATVSIVREDDAPALNAPGRTAGTGDGNGDGILDSAQATVTSAPLVRTNSNNTVFVTLVADSLNGGVDADADTAQIQTLAQQAAPAKLPGTLDLPLGLIDFTAKVSTAGQTESFSLYVPTSLQVNGYWKQDASGTWVNLASAPYDGKVTVEGNKTRLDFKITDGGRFDNDGKADGIITDPGAVGAMVLSMVGYAPDLTLANNGHFFF